MLSTCAFVCLEAEAPSAANASSKVATRRPIPGERAMGYGVSDRIAAVPGFQPLAEDAIWRVILATMSVTVLVWRDEQDYADGTVRWLPLQLDDMTDEQIEIFEAALLETS